MADVQQFSAAGFNLMSSFYSLLWLNQCNRCMCIDIIHVIPVPFLFNLLRYSIPDIIVNINSTNTVTVNQFNFMTTLFCKYIMYFLTSEHMLLVCYVDIIYVQTSVKTYALPISESALFVVIMLYTKNNANPCIPYQGIDDNSISQYSFSCFGPKSPFFKKNPLKIITDWCHIRVEYL